MNTLFLKFRQILVAALALIGLSQPVLARAEAVWTANEDDALLFDVRLAKYRLGDGVRGYQTPQGVCVDMADTILALDLSIRLDKKLRRATGWAFTEERSLTVDRENNIVQIMNKSEKLASGMIVDTPEGWCVQADALSKWFGVTLAPDTGNAVLLIKSEGKLPVELAQERRERAARVRPASSFDLKTLPQAKFPMKGFPVPSVEVVANVGGLRDRSGSSFNLGYEIFASGEAGPLAYDARLASDARGKPDSLRVRAYRKDPEGGLLGPLKATQFELGDVTGATSPIVASSKIGRGAAVGNRPLERPEAFDRTNFRGELPNGWDAELYRNGELLAFAIDRADGRYEFLDIPLLYGRNRFEVVLYGPQGQVRREEKAVTVGLESIPPRKTWYAASLLQDGRDLIGIGRGQVFGSDAWRGTAAVERGLDTRTSIGFSAHSLMIDKVGRRNFLESSLRRALGPALIEVSAATDLTGGYASRVQLLTELGNTSIGLESLKAFGGFKSDRLDKDINGTHILSAYHGLKLGRTTIPISLAGRYITRDTGIDTIGLNTRASLRFGRYNITGIVDYRQDKRDFGPDPPPTLESGLLINARVGRVTLRGEAKYRIKPDPRFDTAKLVAEWGGRRNKRGDSSWRAEIGYDANNRRGFAGLGYVRRFEKFAMTASAEAATDGSVGAGLNVSLALGPDPRSGGGVRMSSARMATEGQVHVRVFHDANGDGIRQPEELGAEKVDLTAGKTPVDFPTDKNGEAIIEDLPPHLPVVIGIDTSSLPDPLVQPAVPGIVVTPRPGVIATVDIPLVSAGEVDGTLVRDGGGAQEGVDLELVNASGAIIARTRSDFDGYFLFESVPYGRYSVRIAKLSAEAARLVQALPGAIDVNGKTPSFHLDVVTAERSDSESAAAD